ncbi:IS110 family transposase [Rhizobium panacihumi]|uniref:IS110 family transposase n=1 Tax=Rhizobium panacihumi TaxID=2008450 RepID=UPI003D7A6EF4
MDHIIVGVDTHKANHIAVPINGHGARLGTITIPATRKGYSNLQAWASELGHIRAFGIEGTGSYGAGLSRELLAHGHTVLDVMYCAAIRMRRGRQSG